MEIHDFVFNIGTTPMATAVTSAEVYPSQEENNIMTLNMKGQSYKVVSWGADNQLPYHLKDAVEKNSVMSQDKFFNVLTCYGRGLEYMDLATRSEKKPLPSRDPEVTRFLLRNSVKRFFAEQITDMKFYFFSVCVAILSRD